MTAPATPSLLGAPARFLLAAVLALGLAFGIAATASAASSPAAENAVGASTAALASSVGLSGDVSPATHLESYDSQAISASATGVAADSATPIAEGNVAHMFRDAAGHLAEDTLANRAVIQSAADSGVLVKATPAGVQTFYQLLPDGTQAWARVFQGEITNGGVNIVPRAP
jgi:hypothetical protein